MPSAINRYPTGLLSMLDAKTGGATPGQLAQELISVIDTAEFYLVSRREWKLGSTAGNWAIGVNLDGTATLTVPPDEIWFCRAFNCVYSATLAAGEIIQAQTMIRLPNGFDFFLGPVERRTVGQRMTIRAELMPFTALPGSTFGAYVSELAVLAAIPTMYLLFDRFKT